MDAVVEAETRLKLIQLAANLCQAAEPMDRLGLLGLIEAPCRHKGLPVSTCLNDQRESILVRMAPSDYASWKWKLR